MEGAAGETSYRGSVGQGRVGIKAQNAGRPTAAMKYTVSWVTTAATTAAATMATYTEPPIRHRRLIRFRAAITTSVADVGCAARPTGPTPQAVIEVALRDRLDTRW